jgi:uncharacterized protein YgiM (DUF1202 family)
MNYKKNLLFVCSLFCICQSYADSDINLIGEVTINNDKKIVALEKKVKLLESIILKNNLKEPYSQNVEKKFLTTPFYLNVRSLSNDKAKILKTLKAGTIIKKISDSNDKNWFYIQIKDGRKGYVNKKYLTQYKTSKHEVTKDTNLRLNKTKIVNTLKKGTIFTSIGETKYWVITEQGFV